MTLEGFGTYGPRLARKGAHLCQHILPDLGVKLAQSLTDARARVNGVGGHGVPGLQPELSLKFLKRDGVARFVHRGLGLGRVFGIFGSAKSVEH